jgi:hypothetical protein
MSLGSMGTNCEVKLSHFHVDIILGSFGKKKRNNCGTFGFPMVTLIELQRKKIWGFLLKN